MHRKSYSCLLLLFFNSIDPNTPSYKEPKFIVFYSMLLNLFWCFVSNAKKTVQEWQWVQQGQWWKWGRTADTGDSSFGWQSQPLVFNGQPVGNMLLSFAVLMAGSTISETRLVFQHMGLSVVSARTFSGTRDTIFSPLCWHIGKATKRPWSIEKYRWCCLEWRW